MTHEPSSPSTFLVPDKSGTRMHDTSAKLGYWYEFLVLVTWMENLDCVPWVLQSYSSALSVWDASRIDRVTGSTLAARLCCRRSRAMYQHFSQHLSFYLWVAHADTFAYPLCHRPDLWKELPAPVVASGSSVDDEANWSSWYQYTTARIPSQAHHMQSTCSRSKCLQSYTWQDIAALSGQTHQKLARSAASRSDGQGHMIRHIVTWLRPVCLQTVSVD